VRLMRLTSLAGSGRSRVAGHGHGESRKGITMRTRQKWVGSIVVVGGAALRKRGSRGMRGVRAWVRGGHGFHHGWRPTDRHRDGPFWGHTGDPMLSLCLSYAYPPVVAVPSTQVYVQPSHRPLPTSPSASWYYCDIHGGIIPSAAMSRGWRAVSPRRHKPHVLTQA